MGLMKFFDDLDLDENEGEGEGEGEGEQKCAQKPPNWAKQIKRHRIKEEKAREKLEKWEKENPEEAEEKRQKKLEEVGAYLYSRSPPWKCARTVER